MRGGTFQRTSLRWGRFRLEDRDSFQAGTARQAVPPKVLTLLAGRRHSKKTCAPHFDHQTTETRNLKKLASPFSGISCWKKEKGEAWGLPEEETHARSTCRVQWNTYDDGSVMS